MTRSYTTDLCLYWGDSEVQTGEADVTVRFTVTEGYPETGPSYASGGEPGQPDMVEDVTIISVNRTPWAKVEYYPSYGRTEKEARETLVEKILDEHQEDMLEAAADDEAAARDAYEEGLAEERRWEREHDQPLWIEGDD